MDWTNRAFELVSLIDPERGFREGEFENMTTAQWATLVAELRTKAGTDHASENVALKQQVAQLSAREAARQKALAAGLTPEEIEDLRR